VQQAAPAINWYQYDHQLAHRGYPPNDIDDRQYRPDDQNHTFPHFPISNNSGVEEDAFSGICEKSFQFPDLDATIWPPLQFQSPSSTSYNSFPTLELDNIFPSDFIGPSLEVPIEPNKAYDTQPTSFPEPSYSGNTIPSWDSTSSFLTGNENILTSYDTSYIPGLLELSTSPSSSNLSDAGSVRSATSTISKSARRKFSGTRAKTKLAIQKAKLSSVCPHPNCNRSFPSEIQCSRHMVSIHKVARQDNTCSLCHVSFDTAKDLRRHFKSIACPSATKEQYDCECGKSFSRKDSLTRHIRTAHHGSKDGHYRPTETP